MRRLVITATAQRDAALALRESNAAFGRQARQRYARLLKAAYQDLQADPERYPSKRPLEALDVRTYAIRHSRGQVPPTERVDQPRHVIVYSHDATTVRILRVLHDRMDLERHVSDL